MTFDQLTSAPTHGATSTRHTDARGTRPRTRPTALAVVAVAAFLALVAGGIVLAPFDEAHRGDTSTLPGAAPRSAVPPVSALVPGSGDRRSDEPTAIADEGPVADGASVLDESSATVARLDPNLLDALRTAATAAREDGVELHVNSGWRSAAEQERLLEEAVARYGSQQEAKRWVATPETSAHVSGDAVDLGPARAAAWLGRHGAAYGLCQVYRNEPWHFELRQGAALHGCPATYADPTQDPRMAR